MKSVNNKEMNRMEIIGEIRDGVLESVQELILEEFRPDEICVSDMVYFYDGLICEMLGYVTNDERNDFTYQLKNLLNVQD